MYKRQKVILQLKWICFTYFNVILCPSSCNDKPEVNQIEIHPYFMDKDIVLACQEFGVIVQAYSPLGNGNMGSRSHYFPDLSKLKIGKKILQNEIFYI